MISSNQFDIKQPIKNCKEKCFTSERCKWKQYSNKIQRYIFSRECQLFWISCETKIQYSHGMFLFASKTLNVQDKLVAIWFNRRWQMVWNGCHRAIEYAVKWINIILWRKSGETHYLYPHYKFAMEQYGQEVEHYTRKRAQILGSKLFKGISISSNGK